MKEQRGFVALLDDNQRLRRQIVHSSGPTGGRWPWMRAAPVWAIAWACACGSPQPTPFTEPAPAGTTASTATTTTSSTPTTSTDDDCATCADIEWVMQLASTGSDEVHDLALAGDDLIVVGNNQRAMTIGVGTPGAVVLEEYCVASYAEGFVLKIRPDQSLSWAVSISSCTGGAIVRSVAVDPSNQDIVVAGRFHNELLVNTGAAGDRTFSSPADGEWGTFVARYDGLGNLLWLNPHYSQGFVELNDVAVSADGTTYAVGSQDQVMHIKPGEADALILPDTNGGSDNLLLSYAPDGTLNWAHVSGEPGVNEWVSAVAATANGVVFTPGMGAQLTIGQGQPNEITLLPTGRRESPLAALNQTGDVSWASLPPGRQPEDAISVGGQDVVTCGYVSETPVVFGEGTPEEITIQPGLGYLSRYDLAGNLLWAAGPTGGDLLFFSLASNSDTLAVGGTYSYDAQFAACSPPTLFEEGALTDAHISTWNLEDGEFQCAWSFGGQNAELADGVAITPEGGIYAAGSFREPITLWRGTAKDTVLTPQSYDAFVVYIPPAEQSAP